MVYEEIQSRLQNNKNTDIKFAKMDQNLRENQSKKGYYSKAKNVKQRSKNKRKNVGQISS
jgi:hypothetical protein